MKRIARRWRVLLAVLAIVLGGLVAAIPAHAASGTTATAIASVNSDITGITEATVNVNSLQQGTRAQGHYSSGGGVNYSFAGLIVTGSCTGTCTVPKVWVGLMQSNQNCAAEGLPCFMVGDDEGAGPNWGSNSSYIKAATNGLKGDGTWHPAITGGSAAAGYAIGVQKDGTHLDVLCECGALPSGGGGYGVVGYFPLSTWGLTSFGTITNIQLVTQVYNPGSTWTSEIPSMEWQLTNLQTDTGAFTVGTWSVDSPYTVSTLGPPFNGYAVIGGTVVEYGNGWFGQLQVAQDIGDCASNVSGDTNGNPVEIEPCDSRSAEQWVYKATTSEIRDPGGYCLAESGTANLSTLVVHTCTGGTDQKWDLSYILDAGDNPATGYETMENEASSKCLQDPSDSTTNGTQLEITTCSTTARNDQSDADFYDPSGA